MSSQPTTFRIYNVAQEYKIIEKVGRGTYGTVYKAKNLKTGELVAIKKIQNKDPKAHAQGFPITALRQINLLKIMDHKNIVKLKEIITSKPQKRNAYRGSTFLVFEYMDHDFAGLFRHKIKYTPPEIKCIVQQILEGVKYLHDSRILHRDIKSANLLLNNKGQVKIADFGLGRKFRPDFTYTSKVVTLWYRAPELLLGTKQYSEKVDIWSVGCIMAEFLIGQVLFRKDTEYMQIHKIYEVCGGLDENNYPQAKQFTCYNDLKPPNPPYPKKLNQTIRKYNPGVDDLTLEFLGGLLSLNPKFRFNCEEALNHQYFKQAPLACKPSEVCRLDMQYHEMYREPKPAQKRQQVVDYKKPPPKFEGERQPYNLMRKPSKDMVYPPPKEYRPRDSKDTKDTRDARWDEREDKDRRKISIERSRSRDRQWRPREDREKSDRLQRDRVERDRNDRERTDRDRIDRERVDRERTERDKLDRDRIDRERVDRERVDRQRTDRERADRQRVDRQKTDRERTDRQRIDRDRIDRERTDRDRIDRQRTDRERLDREKIENERLVKEARALKDPYGQRDRLDRDRDRDRGYERGDRDRKDYRQRDKSRSRGRHDKDSWSRYRENDRSRSKQRSRSRSRRRDDRYRDRSRERDHRPKDNPRDRSDDRRDYRDFREDYKGHKRNYEDEDRPKYDNKEYYRRHDRGRYEPEDVRKNEQRQRYQSKRLGDRQKLRQEPQKDYRDKRNYRERSPPRKSKERSPRDLKKPNIHR